MTGIRTTSGSLAIVAPVFGRVPVAALHLDLFTVGLVLGFAVTLFGFWQPARRGSALAAGNFAAIAALIATRHYPIASVVPLVGMAVGALLVSLAIRRAPPSGDPETALVSAGTSTLWLAGSALIVLLLYLSVPDTEGTVLLLGLEIVLIPVWAIRRWRTSLRDLSVGISTTVGAAMAVGIVGSGGQWSVTGWWVAKLAVIVGFVVAAAVATIYRRSAS